MTALTSRLLFWTWLISVIDSIGLKLLMDINEACISRGTALARVHPSDQLLRMLHIVELNQALTIDQSDRDHRDT